MLTMKAVILTSAVGIGVSLMMPCNAQPPSMTQYQAMTTEWRGADYCLDIVNDGKSNNQLLLAKCGNFSGQHWKIALAKDDSYRLTTEWRGDDLCLDVVNDGKSNSNLQLAKCGNFSGQYWKIAAVKDGYYRLTTEWRGDNMCLDVVNDGKANNMLQLAKCGNFSGQYWTFTPKGKPF